MDFSGREAVEPARQEREARAGGEHDEDRGREATGAVADPAGRVKRGRITPGAAGGRTTLGPGRHLLLR